MELILNTVLLLSNWYSGATLLSILLDSNQDLVCNGETFPFAKSDKRRHTCSCGEFIDQCSFYTQTTLIDKETVFPKNWDYTNHVINPVFHPNKILNRYFSSPVRESSMRNILSKILCNSERLRNFVSEQIKFMDRAIANNNAKIYIDGTKSIRRAQLMANHADINKVKIIHLIRDGRAFCNSYRKNRKIPESELLLAAKEWNDYINLVEKLKYRFKKIEILDVKYEEICNNKNKELNKIFNFLNVTDNQKSSLENNQSHILGNRMRTNFNSSIKEDLSWKEELSPAIINKITNEMQKNLTKYQYL